MGLFWKFILKIYCTAIVPLSSRNSTLFIFPFPFPFLLPFPFLFLLHPTDNCDFEHFSISRTDVHIWWLSFIILMCMFGIFFLFPNFYSFPVCLTFLNFFLKTFYIFFSFLFVTLFYLFELQIISFPISFIYSSRYRFFSSFIYFSLCPISSNKTFQILFCSWFY